MGLPPNMSQAPLQKRNTSAFDGKENTEHRTRCSVTGKIMSTLFERKETRSNTNAAFDEQTMQQPSTQRHSMVFSGRPSTSLPPPPNCSMEQHLGFVR